MMLGIVFELWVSGPNVGWRAAERSGQIDAKGCLFRRLNPSELLQLEMVAALQELLHSESQECVQGDDG